ncbi:hypothetical protein [Chryseobacterium wangxinyae]|uniref:hypothetical protein n=1 Tax=Chryseobacterium sp. CY353 TaxID=2997334 RepID=UPI00226EF730|nr:hypothetical protein [Chryseobacterium sp. CY353]MCY0967895.1 hypothetical protein [Chryseobacterium sp. CY353]
MNTPDQLLRFLLDQPNAYQSDNLASKSNIDHDLVKHLVNQINDYNPQWFSMLQYFNPGIYFFSLNYDKRSKEIEIFLENGGFKSLEIERNRKLEIEDENLKLIKAQQIEIQKNAKQRRRTNIIAIVAIIISIAALVTTVIFEIREQ